MALSDEVKKLFEKWDNNTGWPKRLEWLQIKGVRGWNDERIDFNFPIVAIVGENGSGKSTVLQAAASIYKPAGQSKLVYASEFFPDTAWEKQTSVEIKFSVKEGNSTPAGSVRKLTDRWRGNPERRERNVYYHDLSRLQPVSTRVGYARIARAGAKESKSTLFDDVAVARLSNIIGRAYSAAKRATSSMDASREVTVLSQKGSDYSGFHQGAGEMTIAELVSEKVPPGSLVLIDELETSLHPRSQRRLLQDLAKIARQQDIQFILSTHSPYVLDELPRRARILISNSEKGKTVLTGVTSHYAMTKMDEVAHHDADIYVEDAAAKTLVEEVLALKLPDRFPTIQVSPCGPASATYMLGQMKEAKRFSRPTVVFVDGDQDLKPGCEVLPGGMAPEKFVFQAIIDANFVRVPERLSRDYALVSEAIGKAVTVQDHHQWVNAVANELRVPPAVVWQVLASEWASTLMTEEQANSIVEPVAAALQT